MNNHPEQLEDEIFIGNDDDDDYERVSWRTKRQGQVSYALDGSIHPHSPGGWKPTIRPIFIKRAEVEQTLLSVSNPSYRAIFQKMLDTGHVFGD